MKKIKYKCSCPGGNFTSLKECEIRNSLKDSSSELNNTMWLGEDEFLNMSVAKPAGSNRKRSDSSGISLLSLQTMKSLNQWQTFILNIQAFLTKIKAEKLLKRITSECNPESASADYDVRWRNKVWNGTA